MLKKSITYKTFNEEEVTEDFYFHLSKAELVEMQMSRPGGLQSWLERIVASEDGAAIMEEFKKLILGSYGKKSDDGKRFIKSEELRQDFQSSPAYSVLFMELCTDANKAAEFVNGVIPRGLEQELAQIGGREDRLEQVRAQHARAHPSDTAATPAEPQLLTTREIEEMDVDELKSGLATGKYRLQ